MYEQNRTLTQFPNINTINLYEILSSITNNLSSLLFQAHRTLTLKFQNQQQQKLQHINRLQQQLQTCFMHQEEPYGYIINAQFGKFAKKRFISRMIEILLPYKHQSSKSKYMQPLQSLINQIEDSITFFHQNENLIILTKSLKSYFKTYISIIKVLNNLQFSELTSSSILTISYDKQIIPKEPRSATFKYESETTKQFKKINSIVNRRFKNISCLQIQYSYFRNSYFQVNNDSQEFFEEMMKRNGTIKQKISDYKKNYMIYRAKSRKKKLDKKIILNTQIDARKTERNLSNFRGLTRRISTNIPENESNLFDVFQKTSFQSQNRKRLSLNSRKEQTQPLKLTLSPLKKKIQMKMKNVILTADKYKIQPIRATNYKTFNSNKLSIQNYRNRNKLKNDRLFHSNFKSLCK